MNTTAKILTAAVAFLTIVPQARAAGTSTSITSHAWHGAILLGQAGGESEEAKREEVKRILLAARKAMEAGDLAKAEALVVRSEKKKVHFGLFHLGDTPKKVRRDLESAKANSKTPKLPSTRFQAADAKAKNAETSDPFLAQKKAATGSPKPTSSGRYGNISEPRGLPALPNTAQNAGPANDRAACDQALIAARRALAVGDVQRANSHLEAAQKYQVKYDFHEDSPEKVAAAVRKYQEVISRQKGRQQSEAWRRQYAEVLMEQADALLQWKNFNEAERLANDASRLGVNYGPFEANPRALLDRIASERKAFSTPRKLPMPDGKPTGSVAEGAAGDQKAKALALVRQARQALAAGKLDEADRLVEQAQQLKVPDSAFGPNEDRPWLAALDVLKARQRNGGVVTAGGQAEAGDRYAQRTLYNAESDSTFNAPASATSPEGPVATVAQNVPRPDGLDEPSLRQESPGERLFRQGEEALRAGDKNAALQHFRDAYQFQRQLDPIMQQRLQDHLQILSVSAQPGDGAKSLLDSAAQRQQVLARKLSAMVSKDQADARAIRGKDPKRALELLKGTREKVNDSGLEPALRSQLLRRVDLAISDLDEFIDQNRAQIELDERNRDVLDEVERRRWAQVEKREKLAELVEEFNKLVDEQRYPEAEVVASQALELAPNELVAQQLRRHGRQLMRDFNRRQMLDEKENQVYTALANVGASSTPFDDTNPIVYPDATIWENLTTTRAAMRHEGSTRRTERELEIERQLKTPVSLEFQERPLAEVMDHLARLTGVNIHLDPRGLAEEGVTSNTPVSILLSKDISLRSALNLILEPLHLSYVIKDEVLKITSEQLRDGEVYTVTYNVADLVIPIPNFVPGKQLGLTGQLAEAYGAMGYGGAAGGPGTMAMLANNVGSDGGVVHPEVLAQMQRMQPGMGASGPVMGPAAGPGGLGGGAQADFDSLIELITATIQPNTWDEVGGPGSIKEFETNLSLVVSQTQDVHEEIVDLLDQLRRLQDLQVTIEVRFIRLNDSFFERIGIDFDFFIEDRTFTPPDVLATQDLKIPSLTVGFDNADDAIGGFTADLDIPFTQDSFTSSIPQFGGFDAGTAAQFGFAILSDIEAYFLVNAAQGDGRSNVLEAPKVTLFNGQQAFVSDTVQMPFVISVIPVVGDFAAAQQPVIIVLSEGTFMTIQAVVSDDRRYVRLTVVPFFSQIREVDEFTFEGASTSTTSSSEQGLDDNDNPTDTANSTTETRQGTTVQLPTFAFVTVTTTVSVPDGGTVLLGGIKRLSEARNENGVPMLSKVPYVNRLFRNVGIGRQAESLMMMVTPRIIIQEEEEERLGISSE